MNARTTRTWASILFRAWLRACTVPNAHANSPLATFPEAALSAARVDQSHIQTRPKGQLPSTATNRPCLPRNRAPHASDQ